MPQYFFGGATGAERGVTHSFDMDQRLNRGMSLRRKRSVMFDCSCRTDIASGIYAVCAEQQRSAVGGKVCSTDRGGWGESGADSEVDKPDVRNDGWRHRGDGERDGIPGGSDIDAGWNGGE